MRILGIAALCVMLGGCAASAPDAWDDPPGQEYVGRNVNALMAKWGPPMNTKRLSSGQTSYVWRLGTEMSEDLVRSGSGRTGTYACAVNVITSPGGLIERVQTENYPAGRDLLSFAGTASSTCGGRLEQRWLG